jgi:hypothetical protein
MQQQFYQEGSSVAHVWVALLLAVLLAVADQAAASPDPPLHLLLPCQLVKIAAQQWTAAAAAFCCAVVAVALLVCCCCCCQNI